MAKEAKTVRAAALSVGIFMMTGAAGAATVISGVTPYFGFTDALFNGSLFDKPSVFDQASVNEASSHATVTRPADVQTPLPANLRSRVFQSIERVRRHVSAAAARRVSVCAGEAGIVSPTVVAADTVPASTLGVPEPGSWMLASTGEGTLPFIRRRRLGPVPFE